MKPIVKIGGALIAVAMIFLVVFNPSSCNPPKGNGHTGEKPERECAIRSLTGTVTSGEEIQFSMNSSSDKVVIDSLVYLDDTPVDHGPVATDGIPLGRHSLKARYIYADTSSCESSWSVEILSDIKPEIFTYQVVAMYDHDPASFTQGLIWHLGRLYEGTGQYGESFIHNYDPSLLDYSDRVELPLNLFGEGITILGDKLYQLTWKAGIGKVYDLATMKELREFSIPMEEGWGITDDGTSLILSDGSNVLRYMDPETMEVIQTQAIYNNTGPEKLLNELEYVNGYIYANIYGQPAIAQIDAATGKTIAYIDCRGILPPEFDTPEQDVLNGVAFDPTRQTFFLTGKYWSKMFEVRFLPRPA